MKPLWTPPSDIRDRSRVGRYLSWLDTHRGLSFASYDELWQWSVADLDGFWSSVWEHFEVEGGAPYPRVLANRTMPGAEWFPGTRLNYAQHALRTTRTDQPALVGRSNTRPPDSLSFGQLREQVARAR